MLVIRNYVYRGSGVRGGIYLRALAAKFEEVFASALLILFLFAQSAFAQNYKQDILSVYKNMLGRANYSVDLVYHLYVDDDLKNPFQQRSVTLVRAGKNVHMKQNNQLEVVDNETHQVIIDHNRKIFSAREKEKEENTTETPEAMFGFVETHIDTLLMMFSKITLISANNNKVKYECTGKLGTGILKSWIVIDKKTNLYESITTKISKPVTVNELDGKKHSITVRLLYNGFSTSPVFDKNKFNELAYIEKDKQGRISPAKKYKSYKNLSP